MGTQNKKNTTIHLVLFGLLIFAFLLSAIQPYHRLAWFGQVTPAVLYVLLLVVTYHRFRFTTFAYVMVFFHVLLLLYGAHFTYSNNPLFTELKVQFGWQRNYFDRIGHFAQGFVPAFLFKEFYFRGGYVKKRQSTPWYYSSILFGVECFVRIK